MCAFTILLLLLLLSYSILRVYFLSKSYTSYAHIYIYNMCVYIVYPHTHTHTQTRCSSVCVCAQQRHTRLTTCTSTTTDDRLRAFILVFSRFVSPCESTHIRRYSCARERRRWRRLIRSTFDTSYKPEQKRHNNMRIAPAGDLNAAPRSARDIII